jgi:hypothetical protein
MLHVAKWRIEIIEDAHRMLEVPHSVLSPEI